MIEQTFVFPWRTPPLSANDRKHWGAKARTTRDVRSATGWMCRNLPEMDRVEVSLVWVVADRRDRDVDNLVPTLKVMADALVDIEVVPKDTPAFMVKLMPTIRYEKGATPHFEFRVREITNHTDGSEG